jgi:hypothetical protein
LPKLKFGKELQPEFVVSLGVPVPRNEKRAYRRHGLGACGQIYERYYGRG